ncbi:MAG: fatty acid desaturase [bacterium]
MAEHDGLRAGSNLNPHDIDIDALEADLNALRDELKASAGPADVVHLKKMVRWGRILTVLGYGTAWIAPNPISALLISTAIFGRWAMVAHHVIHRGYDKVAGVPEHLTSKAFAKGWRRWLDWSDWIDPEAWRHEHNTLHHYKLGEIHDPDQPEHNLEWLRDSALPRFLRYLVVLWGAVTWKPMYYAPNTMRTLYEAQQRRQGDAVEPGSLMDWRNFVPFAQPGVQLWLRSYVPYIVLHYVLVPLPFLLIGQWAYFSVLANRLMAEILTNLHAFIVIVPNHAGEDLYRFDTPIEGRGDFYLRQIVGSTNYRTGGDLNDALHGFLNYQIEHHIWPDMTMLQYRRAQPRVAEICRRHGVPYVQESVWIRVKRLVDVLVGQTTMRHWPVRAGSH